MNYKNKGPGRAGDTNDPGYKGNIMGSGRLKLAVVALTICGAIAAGSVTAENKNAAVAPDNTGINERDRSDAALTPMSQSNEKGDIEMTSKIRQSLTQDDSLSVNAQNVKVITIAGKVTLRGPVASDQERSQVVAKARNVAGDTAVNDQLEVTK